MSYRQTLGTMRETRRSGQYQNRLLHAPRRHRDATWQSAGRAADDRAHGRSISAFGAAATADLPKT